MEFIIHSQLLTIIFHFRTCQISHVERPTFYAIVILRALVHITITAYPITHLADVLTCDSTMGGVNIALP